MGDIIIANTSYLQMVKQLYQQGEISIEQYGASLRRYRERKENEI